MTRTLQLSGYEQHKQVMAQRYRHGKFGYIYLISLPLQLVPTHLPIPDPETPFPGNRRVSIRHAEGFGAYWRDNQNQWTCPPLLLDTLYPLKDGFEAELEVHGVEFGTLNLPHNSSVELQILDGQHRVLGWKIAVDDILADLKKARESLQASRHAEDEVGIQTWENKVAELNDQQRRLTDEFVSLEVIEGITTEQHKQFFSDIANNAKGITKSVTVSFDRRSVLNRVAMDLALNNELLAGRVEMEKDRVMGSNENLVSGRNLVDLVRHAVLGIDGRMTARRESDMKESAIADIAEQFFKVLVESFPPLRQVQEEELEATELRDTSLLGSSTILRVLAGAYHLLAVDITDEKHAHVTPAGDAAARRLFENMAPHMTFPVAEAWLDTGVFPSKEAKAPSSRAQDLKSLTKEIARWADESPF